MPNLNAALLVAQLEQLDDFLQSKKEIAKKYEEFFSQYDDIKFIKAPKGADSNYWLNGVLLKDEKERDQFLAFTNEHGVMTRPIWKLMNELEMFKDAQKTNLDNAKSLAQRVVNIPSSAL